MLVGDLICSA